MTAPNHALTGALIGMAVGNPVLAVALAFLSHFVCDAIPHYDPPGDAAHRISSKRLIIEQILIGGAICFFLVVCLALAQPGHWLLAAICAFAATSPDFFWIPRWLHVRKTHHDLSRMNPFLRFHAWIQWKTGPRLIALELAWFVVFGGVLAVRLAHL